MVKYKINLFEGEIFMKLISIQIALFTEKSISRPDLVYNNINEKLGDIFNDMPMIVNLPADVPADVPRVQAKSENGNFSLNVSLNRVDFFVNPEVDLQLSPDDALKIYKSKLEKYYKSVTSALNIIRVGVILTLFEQTESNVKQIFEKYCTEKYTLGYSEITYRTNEQTMYNNLLINNIKLVESGEMHHKNAGFSGKGVLVQLDTNNIPQIQKRLNNEEISDIFGLAIEKIKPKAVKELI